MVLQTERVTDLVRSEGRKSGAVGLRFICLSSGRGVPGFGVSLLVEFTEAAF